MDNAALWMGLMGLISASVVSMSSVNVVGPMRQRCAGGGCGGGGGVQSPEIGGFFRRKVRTLLYDPASRSLSETKEVEVDEDAGSKECSWDRRGLRLRWLRGDL